MRGSLPIICSGQARRTDGPSSPTVPNQGAYGPARPTLGGWPSPERQLEIFADSRQSEHARGMEIGRTAAANLPAPQPDLLPVNGEKGRNAPQNFSPFACLTPAIFSTLASTASGAGPSI